MHVVKFRLIRGQFSDEQHERLLAQTSSLLRPVCGSIEDHRVFISLISRIWRRFVGS